MLTLTEDRWPWIMMTEMTEHQRDNSWLQEVQLYMEEYNVTQEDQARVSDLNGIEGEDKLKICGLCNKKMKRLLNHVIQECEEMTTYRANSEQSLEMQEEQDH